MSSWRIANYALLSTILLSPGFLQLSRVLGIDWSKKAVILGIIGGSHASPYNLSEHESNQLLDLISLQICLSVWLFCFVLHTKPAYGPKPLFPCSTTFHPGEKEKAITPCKSSGGGLRGDNLLLRRVVGEVDALFDVTLETLGASLQQSLLLRGEVTQRIDGLHGTVRLSSC
jgi:hypothetical protein